MTKKVILPEDLPKECSVLARLDDPHKIQDFVSGLRWNFEPEGNTCRSVVEVLSRGEAHCIEGAMTAALAFWMHGEPPLLMDFDAADYDDDHVVALFKRNGKWGAISKSNHAYLRYRDPVYQTLRELAMSYFPDYFNKEGKKSLRSYSRALDLRTLGVEWIAANDAWSVARKLVEIRHYSLLSVKELGALRPLDAYERSVFSMPQYRRA